MGDHVKVIAGRYEGDTGLIVRVEDNMVVLFSDLTMHEVRTLPILSTLYVAHLSDLCVSDHNLGFAFIEIDALDL